MSRIKRLIGWGLFGWLLSVLVVACNSAPPTPALSSGVGLSVEYFSNSEFKGPAYTQISTKVNFNWGQIAPVLGMQAGTFSARWQGFIQPEFSEAYTFFVSSQGDALLWVDGQRISPGESKVHLRAGQRYAIRLEYRKTQGLASLALEWASPHTKRTLVPQNRLYPAVSPSTIAPLEVPAGQNLLLNPSFEEGTSADGWVIYSGSAKVEKVENRGQVLSSSGWTWVQQDLPFTSIEPGRAYTFEAWGSASSGATCIVGLGFGGETHDISRVIIRFNGDWQKQFNKFIVPETTTWMAAYMSGGDPSCRFDEVSLSADSPDPQPASRGPNLLDEGDFEKGLEGWAVIGNAQVTNDGHDSKYLLAKDGTWIQHDLEMSSVLIGQPYILRASMFRANTNYGSCTVGFVAGNLEKVLFAGTLGLRVAEGKWVERAAKVNIPADSTWAAVYLSTIGSDCKYDNIWLTLAGESNIGNLTPAQLVTGVALGQVISKTVTFTAESGILSYKASLSNTKDFKFTAGDRGFVGFSKTATISIQGVCPNTETVLSGNLVIESNDFDEPTKTIPITVECFKPLVANMVLQETGLPRVGGMNFDPNNRLAVAVEQVHIYDLAKKTTSKIGSGSIGYAGWIDSNRILTGECCNSVFSFWDSNTGALLASQDLGTTSGALSPDFRKTAFAGSPRSGAYAIAVRDVQTGETIASISLPVPALRYSWSQDSAYLAVQQSGGVDIYDLKGTKVKAIANTPTFYLTRWVSPTSLLYARPGVKTNWIVFDIETQNTRLSSDNPALGLATASPDGKKLAGWNRESKSIEVISSISGVTILSIPRGAFVDTTTWVYWSPDGRYLATSNSGTLEVWEITSP